MPKPKAKAKPKSKAAAAAASKREATKNNNAVSAEKENEMQISDPTSVPIREQCRGGAESMYTIMRHAELKESLHKRYEKERMGVKKKNEQQRYACLCSIVHSRKFYKLYSIK
ncbi:uncharacterized protein LOC117189711 [Drosophila miranda]|uniref:uncharacterized protein LOC117189710 n=1 Tax=Drosophila miranda TaxID=7229 RepID=UPI00143FABC7|nr:uncharacterized protein LOC117189710 [Drosophila miranda]XP_033250694.1 uncharacterized protein LOC117189711 [Drosophila miranda]